MKAKNASIMGIIQSIMALVEDCLGSAAGIVVIFCCNHVEAPTSTGRMGVGSGLARSSPKKLLFNGTIVSPTGFQEYTL